MEATCGTRGQTGGIGVGGDIEGLGGEAVTGAIAGTMTCVETGLETDAGTCAVTRSWTDVGIGAGTGSVGIGVTVIEVGVGKVGCDGMDEGVLVVSDPKNRKEDVEDCAGCGAVGLEDKDKEGEKSCSLNKTCLEI